jgi:hypothetical protein
LLTNSADALAHFVSSLDYQSNFYSEEELHMRLHLSKALAAVVFASLCTAPVLHAGLILDVQDGGVQAECGAGCGAVTGKTFGWAFTVLNPITVVSIGAWDTGSNGLGRDTEAGLWTAGGTLLASATITNSSTPVASASSLGGWLFESIAPLTLNPGNYALGLVFTDRLPLANIGGVTTISDIGGVTGRTALSPNTGLQFPATPFVTVIVGPNLQTADATTVPEPGSIALCGLGLAFLAVRLRKRTDKA